MRFLSKVGVFMFVSTLLVSCSRDYNCTCSYDYSGTATDDTKKSFTIPDTKEKSATKKCDLYDEKDNGTGRVVDCGLNP